RINKVFIFDINVDSDYEGFFMLKKKYDIFLIDHHPSDLQGKNIIKTKSEDCTTFAIFEMTKEKFDLKKWEWLVCATMVSEFSFKDKSNFEFIKKHYPNVTLEEIYNSEPGEISKKLSSALIYLKRKKKKVFNLIFNNKLKRLSKYHEIIEAEIKEGVEKFKKEAEFYPEKNLYFYYGNPKYSVTSTIATFLSVKEPDKTFVFVSDINDEPDFIKVTSRNNNGRENMNLLMKKGIRELENANGGGHVPAAAARFLKKDLEKFKENILK
ncbi:MAG: DHH family phosphoesterase, partial [Nanoarchaeota archaeon]